MMHTIIGTTGLVKRIPSLAERLADVPLLVNQALLRIKPTDLDGVRHRVAETIMNFYRENAPAGNVQWLGREVERWIEKFSPETALSHSESESESESEREDEGLLLARKEEPEAHHIFRPDGDGWEIVYKGEKCPLLNDCKSLHIIHNLLQHPGPEGIHILDLVTSIDRPDVNDRLGNHPSMTDEQFGEDGLVISTWDTISLIRTIDTDGSYSSKGD